MTKKEALLIFILASIQFLHIMDFMIIMPLGDVFINEFEINAAKFSVMIASYSVSAGIFGLIGSVYFDPLDRKKSIMIAFTGFIVGTAICAMAPSYPLMVAGRIITGCFGGLITSLVLAITGDEIAAEKRARGMAYVMLGFSVSSVVGVPTGLVLANHFGWRAPFIVIVLMSIGLWVFMNYVLWSMTNHLEGDYKKKSLLQSAVSIFEQQQLRLGILFIFLLILGQFTVIPFITPYLIRNVGLSFDQVPFIYFAGGAMTLISSPTIGKLADKFGRKKVFYFIAPLSMVMIFIITNMPPLVLGLVMLLNGLMFVMVSGRFIPSNALMTLISPIHLRGSYMGFITATINVSAGLASLLAGQIIIISKIDETLPVQHFDYIGYLAIIASILAIVVVSKIREPQ